MTFVATGVNHRTLPVELRERLFVASEKLPLLFQRLLSSAGLEEAVIVSTCNRTELYAIIEPAAEVSSLQLAICQELGVSPFDVANGWSTHANEQALRHLFRVVASLDSMLVGETQIFCQVKEAYDAAYRAGATGSLLNQLFHRAFFVAKRVRTETGIGTGPTSLSSIAVDLIERSVCFRTPPSVLVIGTGEVGRDAAKSFAKRELGRLIIINRTPEKAQQLASELKAEAMPWDQLPEALAQAAAVISCSGAAEPLLTAPLLALSRQRSERKTLTIVDLGVPRDVAADVSRVEGTTVYTIDDLQAIADKNRTGREQEIFIAEKIIAEEVTRAYSDIVMALPEPTIAELMQKCETIRRREVSKALGRVRSLSNDERNLIEQCTTSIVAKILHDPICVLKHAEADDRTQRLLDALRQVFRLHDTHTPA